MGETCKQKVLAGVGATARPGMEAWRTGQAGEVEGPLLLELGLQLGQVGGCVTKPVGAADALLSFYPLSKCVS